jgi:Rieske Fe-S protein
MLYPLSYGRWELRWVTIPPARMHICPRWATLMGMEPTGLPPMSRRAALRAAAGLCGLALLASGASTAQATPAPRGAIRRLPGGRVAVALNRVPALRRVGGVATIGDVRGVPTAVVRTSRNTYIALDLRCTHFGVTVSRAGNGWGCPAHGSRFTRAGGYVSGPANGPLRRVKSQRQRGELFVG